jgi:hypothetical protein
LRSLGTRMQSLRFAVLLSGALSCASPTLPPLRESGELARASGGEPRPAPYGREGHEPQDAGTPASDIKPSPRLAPMPEWSSEERQRIARVQPWVRAAAKEHGIDASFINAVIWVESRFDHKARGKRGPRGLMQIMPRTGRLIARELKLRYQPSDPRFNIRAGSHYLARMLEIYDGDEALALAAYQTGPGTVKSWRDAGTGMPEQSRLYVARVFAAQEAFRERLGDSPAPKLAAADISKRASTPAVEAALATEPALPTSLGDAGQPNVEEAGVVLSAERPAELFEDVVDGPKRGLLDAGE